MLQQTIAVGAPPPTVNAPGILPLFPVEMPPGAKSVPPPAQPPPPLSSYPGLIGASFPGPASVSGPAILPSPPMVQYVQSR
jgi:hypothetical protein